MPETADPIVERVAALPIWARAVEPLALSGGITNRNFLVDDGQRKVVVRVGGDNPVHCVVREREHAASRAAHAAGVSPEVLYAEPDILVLGFIEGVTFGPEDVRKPANLDRLVDLVQRYHRGVPNHYRGHAIMFWPFQVVREYAHILRAGQSPHEGKLAGLAAQADRLEAAVGPIDVVFGHNDLLAANFIDDGKKLWIVDWEYSGFNSPLFDLGGMASNNGFSDEMEDALLDRYFGRAPDAALKRKMAAMSAISLMREAMWSMASELHSTLAFDYDNYTAENLKRLDAAYARFENLDGQ
jgi:thiamine kinase-like enzyme